VIEQRILRRLDEAGVVYDVIECDPALADTADFCAHYGYPLDRSANTIVVAARRPPGAACACVVLADTRLDVNHRVCELMGVRKASFASAGQTEELTGMMIGGVTPFALPDGLPVYVDGGVLEKPWVIVGGGSRSMKLKMNPQSLVDVAGARVIEGLAIATA